MYKLSGIRTCLLITNIWEDASLSEIYKQKLLPNKHLPKNIFACLFSVHNGISLSRHEQVCLSILVHYVIN